MDTSPHPLSKTKTSKGKGQKRPKDKGCVGPLCKSLWELWEESVSHEAKHKGSSEGRHQQDNQQGQEQIAHLL